MLKTICMVAFCEVTQMLVFAAIICINLFMVVFNSNIDLIMVMGACIVLITCQNMYSAIGMAL